MGHAVHCPGRACIQRQGPPAGLFGLRQAMALLQAEGPQRQHMRVQRIVLVPLGQRASRPTAQGCGIATEEVPQLGPLQREGVAWVLDQQAVPDATGAGPAAVEHLLHGLEVSALARRRYATGEGARRVKIGAGLRQQRGFGEAGQKAGLHGVRQAPAGVSGDGGVEIGERRVVERHHAPQGHVDRRARSGRAAAQWESACVLQRGHGAKCTARA